MVINFKLKNMKQILLLAVLALGINASAQITEIETPKSIDVYDHVMGFHSISKSINQDSTETYYLIYKDCQYQQISVFESIIFKSKEDIVNFFNLVKETITSKESKTLDISGETVRLVYTSRTVQMYVGNSFCWWSTKWADKCLEAIQ